MEDPQRIHGRYTEDARRMHRGCVVDARRMHSGCKAVAGWVCSRCRAEAQQKHSGCWADAQWVHAGCVADTGAAMGSRGPSSTSMEPTQGRATGWLLRAILGGSRGRADLAWPQRMLITEIALQGSSFRF